MTGRAEQPTDADLLHAHVAGDPHAFGELVRRHRDRLWAVALRTLGDREEAADALQEALISAYRAADRFRGDAAVTTWLHRIVVNACLDRARRRQARPALALADLPPNREPAAVLPDQDTAREVWAALAQLPVEQRVPLVLLEIQGYSVAEIAEILGVAEGTVKSRCARGRARLAVLLGHLRGADRPPEPARAGTTDPNVSTSHPGAARGGGNPTDVPGVGSTIVRQATEAVREAPQELPTRPGEGGAP
jgi:RNA polymerase sigma-70 factor (ECF subfamily)